MRIFTLFFAFFLIMHTNSQNLVQNSDFSINGGSFDNWEKTDGTILEQSGTDNIAFINGENGVLYQRVSGIKGGTNYQCSIIFTDALVKQTTGYGYATEFDTPLPIPTFTVGANNLSGFCNNNNGLWIPFPYDISSEEIITFNILTPEGATALYLCMGTKGAVARMRIKSVSLIELSAKDVIFTVKQKTDDTPVENAMIMLDGIATTYYTNASGNTTIQLPPSSTPYQFKVLKDWYKEYNGLITVSGDQNHVIVELEDIQEVKKVETRISKYGDNATPYPLYGHFWDSGLNYDNETITKLTDAFDYIIGGSGVPGSSSIVDQLHAADPKFQVISYSGGWTQDYSLAEDKKMDMAYYQCGYLSQAIDATTTTIVLNAPPTNKGKGLIASEEGHFDIWIRVENELMKVTQVSSTTTYPISVTVERGFGGTVSTTHIAGKAVTLPLYGETPPTSGNVARNYFINCFGIRKQKLEDALFSVVEEKHFDGIWIDILMGRLSATSLMNNGYVEWDHNKEQALTGIDDVAYTKSAMHDLYQKFYSRKGYYPTIYGNNVLYSSALTEGTRAYAMVQNNPDQRIIDGFCHENSWGHMSSDDSGIDNDEVIVSAEATRIYGTESRFLECYMNNTWLEHCKAISLLSEEGLPNQPMTINAGFKNQWFAANLSDQVRYDFNKYAYASYLMSVHVTTDSMISCRMGISPLRNNNGEISVEVEPFFYYPIGIPTETNSSSKFTDYRYNNENIYARNFSNGVVLLNPMTNNMNQTISLAEITGSDKTFIDPENNNAVVTHIQLNSRESKILLFQQDTGLGDIYTNAQTIKSYPTPTKNILNIELPKYFNSATTDVEILSLNGKVVRNSIVEILNGRIQIDVSKLNKGFYILQMAKGMYVCKIIKD